MNPGLRKARPRALPDGYRFDDFEILRTLGVGGFGITYLGLDVNLGKQVAIKEYFPESWAQRLDDASVQAFGGADGDEFEWGRQRFLDEAKTLARFSHPNIVSAYRYFTANGTGYIVMDYVEGEGLDRRLQREGRLPAAQVRSILEQLVAGLATVHRHQVLHRDIKPANVILRAGTDVPVLIDFGSAREAVQSKTLALTALVSPGYAPYEQYSSEGSHQGPWTDLYAVSALGYRALTGKLPPDAGSRFENDALEALDAAHFDHDEALCRTINQSLRLRTRERPASAAEWLELAEAAVLSDARPSGHEGADTRLLNAGAGPTRLRTRYLETPPQAETQLATEVIDPLAPPPSPAPADAPRWRPIALLLSGVLLVLGATLWLLRPQPGIDRLQPELVAATPNPRAAPPAAGSQLRDCQGCPDMVVLPTGRFRMGASAGNANELPEHEVQIATPFAISVTEVTVSQWQLCRAAGSCRDVDPAAHGADLSDGALPITMVSYRGAEEYAEWLSQHTASRYRLPSEAEWEYAARAGGRGGYAWGDDPGRGLANCADCGPPAEGRLLPVARYAANAFGVFDAHGNVWEWVRDCWSPDYGAAPVDGSAAFAGNCNMRVIRGGSYADPAASLRSANRNAVSVNPPSAAHVLGFRVVKEYP